MLLNGASGGISSDSCQQLRLREEMQEERMQRLQATVEAQGKLLKAMADKLKITDYE